MTMLGKAWNAVSNKIFTSCFKEAGISEKEVKRVVDDEDDPFPVYMISEKILFRLWELILLLRRKILAIKSIMASCLMSTSILTLVPALCVGY